MVFMRNLLSLASFLLIFNFFFITSFFLLISLSQKSSPYTFYVRNSPKMVSYAALPTDKDTLSYEITKLDARVELVRQFLARYNSPLEPNAQDIINAADAYGIDFRLIPAIAMQESSLCKKIVVDNADHNCWGYGIYGSKATSFNSYKDGIEIVTKALAKYKKQGLETPEDIMQRYAPRSDGSWSFSVEYFMDKLQ